RPCRLWDGAFHHSSANLLVRNGPLLHHARRAQVRRCPRCPDFARGRGMRVSADHGKRRAAACVTFVLMVGLCFPGQAAPKRGLHYAPNGNFDASGIFLPAELGFNLADVRSVGQLDALPNQVKGLAWIGQCNGADTAFRDTVRPYIGNPRLFGFFLVDDPDPRRSDVRGVHPHACKAEDLKAESDWIHANFSSAKTFIVLMNLSSSRTPSFGGTYAPRNSHVDFF